MKWKWRWKEADRVVVIQNQITERLQYLVNNHVDILDPDGFRADVLRQWVDFKRKLTAAGLDRTMAGKQSRRTMRPLLLRVIRWRSARSIVG